MEKMHEMFTKDLEELKNKQGRKNYKESTGTKLITNTRKRKLKI